MRVGRVEATASFLLAVAWMNYLDRQGIVPLAMLACALHELGHYWTIHFLGGDVRLIRLTAIGAEMALSRPLSYGREGLAALAGPGANLLLALVFCRWEWGLLFAGLNLVLGFFNLMPVGRLDGGRALSCALSLAAGPELAQKIGRWMDTLFTGLLLGAGIWLAVTAGNWTMLLVALWLMGAGKR